MKHYATLQGETFELERGDDSVRIDGRELPFTFASLGGDEAHIRLGTRGFHVHARPIDGGWRVRIAGRELDIALEDARARHIRELTGADPGPASRDLRAPMPGLVVKVMVEVGQVVEAGDGLVVVEAMKMENELRAEAGGRVAGVEVATGQTVDRDDVLVRFEEDS